MFVLEVEEQTNSHNFSFIHYVLREAAKKVLLLMAGPFFGTFFFQRSNVPTFQRPLISRGGPRLGLNGPAIKRRTFFAASLSHNFFLRLILFYWNEARHTYVILSQIIFYRVI